MKDKVYCLKMAASFVVGEVLVGVMLLFAFALHLPGKLRKTLFKPAGKTSDSRHDDRH